MAIALIQHNIGLFDGSGGFNQTPLTISFGANVRSGDTIIVCITSFKWYVDSISDTQGNSYVRAKQTTNGGSFADYADIWYAENVKGGACTITPHYTNYDSNNHVTSVGISEWTGIARVSHEHKTNGATGTGTAVSPGAVTPTNDGALIIGVGHNYNGSDNTVAYNTGGGFAKLDEQLGTGATYTRFYSEYLIQGSKAAATASYTLNGSSDWQTSVAAFAASASANINTLSDNFNDNSRDTSKWNAYTANSGAVAESGEAIRYTLAASTNGSWAGYNSVNKFNLVGSKCFSRFLAAVTGNSWLDMTLSLEALGTPDNFISVGINVGTQKLEAVQEINGVDTVLVSIDYDPNVHIWGQLREASGVLYFEHSRTGLPNDWTTYHSMTPPINLTDLYVILDDFAYNGSSTPSVHAIDCFNIAPTIKKVAGVAYASVKKQAMVTAGASRTIAGLA